MDSKIKIFKKASLVIIIHISTNFHGIIIREKTYEIGKALYSKY